MFPAKASSSIGTDDLKLRVIVPHRKAFGSIWRWVVDKVVGKD